MFMVQSHRLELARLALENLWAVQVECIPFLYYFALIPNTCAEVSIVGFEDRKKHEIELGEVRPDRDLISVSNSRVSHIQR